MRENFTISMEEPSKHYREERFTIYQTIVDKQGIMVNSEYPATYHFAARSDQNNRLLGVAEIDVKGKSGVFGFMVDPDHQNQGIGKSLLSQAIDFCKQSDLSDLLATTKPYSVSEHLLVSQGFEFFDPGKAIRWLTRNSPRSFLRLDLRRT